MRYRKIPVEVVVRFSEKGGMRPLYIVWQDGRKFEIDRVKYCERASAHVSAILPLRYTCIICGKEKQLFYERENENWFVEKEESNGEFNQFAPE